MAHKQQQDFVKKTKEKFPQAFKSQKVLEIGSLNVNGTVRIFFENCDYTGVDVGPGPDVDVVGNGEELDYADGMFDTTISTECFEHTPFWKEIFLNMVRMTRSNGLIIFTCASTGRPEHGTRKTTPRDAPLLKTDYYKNLDENDFASIDLNYFFTDYKFEYNSESKDLYFYGIRR